MIERAPTYTPAYIRGWNAAMSHAEDYLVCMACHAAATAPGEQRGPGSIAYYAEHLLHIAADKIGVCRKPTPRHYG